MKNPSKINRLYIYVIIPLNFGVNVSECYSSILCHSDQQEPLKPSKTSSLPPFLEQKEATQYFQKGGACAVVPQKKINNNIIFCKKKQVNLDLPKKYGPKLIPNTKVNVTYWTFSERTYKHQKSISNSDCVNKYQNRTCTQFNVINDH